MPANPDWQRVHRALLRQGSPAEVPLLDFYADAGFIAKALDEPCIDPSRGESDQETQEHALDQRIRFWHGFGYDVYPQNSLVSLTTHHLTPRESRPGAGTRQWVNENAGIITSWPDFENYPWQQVSQVDFSPYEYLERHLPEGMAILAEVNGLMEPLLELMGLETLAFKLYDEPELVQALVDRLTEIFLPQLQAFVEMDRVMAIYMGDDLGFRTGTFISPKWIRQLIFPFLTQAARITHDHGRHFLLHSCGKLDKLMGELIEVVGIDAKQSFEDNIQPVEEFTRQYGGRIGVIGGVDMDILVRGSENDVQTRTRQILEACTPTGGYLLGSGNSLADFIPPRNYFEVLSEWRRFTASAA